MLGIIRDLESVTGIVGSEIGNEDERLPCTLLRVIHSDAVSLDLCHATLPLRMSDADVSGRSTDRRGKRQSRSTCLQQAATRDNFRTGVVGHVIPPVSLRIAQWGSFIFDIRPNCT